MLIRTGVESRWLAAQLGTDALVDDRASERALRSAIGGVGLIHLETQGFAFENEARSRESFVALAADPMAQRVWPRWSPDGKFLSFSSNLIRGSIWMMPADSGPPRLVADSTGPYGVFSDQPLWSPDGRSILTRSTNEEGDATFWQVPLNGEGPHLLLTFNGQGPRPSRGGWGIHGNRIVYTAPVQHSDVWVMEVQKPSD